MQTKTLQDVTEVVHVFAHRQLSETARMQAIRHQVVGSENKGHEDVKLMYEKFFGGKAVRVRKERVEEDGINSSKSSVASNFPGIVLCTILRGASTNYKIMSWYMTLKLGGYRQRLEIRAFIGGRALTIETS